VSVFSFLSLLVGVLVAVRGARCGAGRRRYRKVRGRQLRRRPRNVRRRTWARNALRTDRSPQEPSKKEAEESGYTQAGGHVPFGVTDFKVTTVVNGKPLATTEAPTAIIQASPHGRRSRPRDEPGRLCRSARRRRIRRSGSAAEKRTVPVADVPPLETEIGKNTK